MTKKKYGNISVSEALSIAWKNRKNYKGYDKSKGSSFNSWRAIVYTQKGKRIGFPESWRLYNNFLSDVGEGWERGKVLCRINTSLPYSKENCEWREKGQELLSLLSTLTYNNETKTLLEWCNIYNLNYNGVRQRLFKGKNFTPEQILFGKRLRNYREIKDINDIKFDSERKKKATKMLNQYKLKDKKRGYDFNIDLNWFKDQVENGHCFYCGDTKRLGLDRIDNNKGHTMDNVVVCCYDCNVARSNNFSHEEMIILGKTINEIKSKRNGNY